MRLFFAIDVPDGLRDSIAAVQDDLRAAEGLSFTDPDQAHLTMKFLGEIPTEEEAEDDEPTVADAKRAGAGAAEAAGLGSFEVALAGLGAFPSEAYVSVVWTGVEAGAAELGELATALESAATDRGFDAADNPFTPHVTLARMNDARGKEFVQSRVRDENPNVGRFTAEELRLKRSLLRDDGANHETIARFPL
jgi:2'-5' RNA ligase